MARKYYKSDFDCVLRLKDRGGNAVPFPDCDFEARFYTASSARAYVARRRGDRFTNCFPEDGGMHFVFNNHNLGIGKLKWEPHFRLPNSIYPDGLQDVLGEEQLDIELVEEEADCEFGETEIVATIPAVYLTAYDLAVRNGYTGSLSEYVSYVNRLPEVVETSGTVMRLLSDFSDGKARIADALTRQGIETATDEPLQAMADKVLDLRLAVEGQPGITDQTLGGVLPTYDLLNELRNHQRADYPYCCGVLFPRVTPSVELKMADAYLCSDGFFTEEQDVAHTLADIDRDLSYVIYYFRERRYTVPTYIDPILRAFALNGHPCWALDKLIPDIRSYSEDLDEYESADIITAGNSFQHLTLAGVRGLILSSTIARSCGNLLSLSLPDLEGIDGTKGYLADTCSIYSLHFPKLREISGRVRLMYNNSTTRFVSLPSLESIKGDPVLLDRLYLLRRVNLPRLSESGGIVIASCAALTELSLPSLTTISGGNVAAACAALTELSLPNLTTISGGSVADSCAALTELSLPNLTTISGGNVAAACAALTELSLPSLTTISGGNVAASCAALTELSLPALETCSGTNIVQNWQVAVNLTLRLDKLRRIQFWNGLGSYDTGEDCVLELFMPRLEWCNGSFGRGDADRNRIIVHLGAAQDGYFDFYFDVGHVNAEITVEPGFRSQLRTANGSWRLTAECMRNIIANLGDNTCYPTLPLVFGAANLAKLTEEDIAMATSKNYTLS